jgi:hypothetical protein
MNLTTLVNQLGRTEYVEVAGRHFSAGTYLMRRKPIELHALYPTRRSMSGKVCAFIDALIGHLDTVKLTSSRD